MPVEVCSHYVPFFVSPTPPSASFVCFPPTTVCPPFPSITGGLYRPTTFLLPPSLCVPLSFWPCPRVVSPSRVSRISVFPDVSVLRDT